MCESDVKIAAIRRVLAKYDEILQAKSILGESDWWYGAHTPAYRHGAYDTYQNVVREIRIILGDIPSVEDFAKSLKLAGRSAGKTNAHFEQVTGLNIDWDADPTMVELRERFRQLEQQQRNVAIIGSFYSPQETRDFEAEYNTLMQRIKDETRRLEGDGE